MKKSAIFTVLICSSVLLAACGKKPEEAKKGPPAALITVVQAQIRSMQMREESVGVVDTLASPTVSAEVAARVAQVLVDIGDPVKKGQLLAVLDTQDLANSRQAAAAEVARVEALLANQQRATERYRELIKQKFIAPLKLDEAESQLAALRAQLAAAQAQSANAGSNLSKARITAPMTGHVDQRMVSPGDFVSVGKPMFQLVAAEKLRVRLPFPEGVVGRIRPGLTVYLSTPAVPDRTVQGKVEEIRPIIGASNRAFEAVVVVANPGDWKPGASVNGAVVVAEHPQAVVVPETSVVLRPAGKVVYLIKDQHAAQRIVQTGLRRDGYTEILSGLAAGETVALDGAGFLTDKALVKVQNGGAADSSSGGKQ
jgi:membrane fusion protein (multidrug efflux system)